MKFGAVPLDDAIGAILAHGVPAASLAKGITLGAGHIDALRAFGLSEITVARLEDGDVGEDEAAAQLARALVPDDKAQGLRLIGGKTGRVNIMVHRAGLVRLDVARLIALNRVDPMITLATLPDLARVRAGVMLATIKIISYGVPKAHLDAACDLVTGGDAVFIQSATFKTASLIETHHAGKGAAPKGRRALDERLDRLGCNLIETLDVPHDIAAIAAAIEATKGEAVFILTASATSDINDTAPSAVRAAGGTVEHYGMPVDPGNLLFVGACDRGRPIIGLPGCARSPAMNGADLVLERIICGVPVGGDDISAMGVGGLLKEVTERGRPR